MVVRSMWRPSWYQAGKRVQKAPLDSLVCMSLADHIFGIPGMLCSICNQRTGGEGASEESPIHLVGVPGLADFVLMSMRLSRTFLGVPLVITELMNCPTSETEASEVSVPRSEDGATARKRPRRQSPPRTKTGETNVVLPRSESYFCPEVRLRKVWPSSDGMWTIEETKEVKIEAAPLYHTVPCVGFSLQEPDTAGNLDINRIRPLFTKENRAALAREGISPAEKLLQRFKLGERIVLPDGQVMDPDDESLITRPHKGRKLVFMGDNSGAFPAAHGLAESADLLVHEATNALTSADVAADSNYATVESKAVGHGHSTPVMTGGFARSVGARLTALTHFSGRYKPGPAGCRVMQEIVDQAEAARLGTASHEDIMRTVEESLTFGTKNAGRRKMAELVVPPREDHVAFSVEESAFCVHRGRVFAAHDFMTLQLGWKRDASGNISVEVGADDAIRDFAARSEDAMESGSESEEEPAATTTTTTAAAAAASGGGVAEQQL